MRVSSGVPGFDRLVEGGLLDGRLYILSGPPGSGKTTFSAHFVTEGQRQDEKCLYMSMHETEAELASDMGRYDFGFLEALESSRVHFMNVLSEKSQNLLVPRNDNDYRSGLQNMTTRIVNFIDKNDIDRLVIDSTMLLRYFYEDEPKTFIQFVSSLKNTEATILLISEMTDPSSYADEHYLAHGVVFFHSYLEPTGMKRGIQIIKMRGTDIDADIHEIDFSDSGLEVYPDRTVEIES